MGFKIKKWFILGLTMTLLLVPSVVANAEGITAGNSQTTTDETSYSALTTAINTTMENKQYQSKDGGYIKGTNIFDAKTGKVNDNFQNLTTDSKQQMLKDMNSSADAKVSKDSQNPTGQTVSSDTKTTWLQQLQASPGVGSQLMTTLFSQTKPDYVKAARIYAPFQGPISTVLGVVAIVICAGVTLTMGADILYLSVPIFRNFLDGGEGGSASEGRARAKKTFVSFEATNAVTKAESSGNEGSNKVALWIYFKARAVALLVLGLCLFYLISGNIFTLIGYVLDLVSGFMG